jgi:hypothetical protein
LLLMITALAVAALACGPSLPNIDLPVTKITPGPTETLAIDEPRPDGDAVVDVTLDIGPGNVSLSGGAEGLASGTVQYNVAEWKPVITRDDDSLTIEQKFTGGRIGIPEGDLVNEWDVQLGDVPMRLTVNAGAYEGQADLGGLPLQRLEFNDGASTNTVTFDEVNPEEMALLKYTTGASTVELNGLANANFTEMIFEGGAGTYTLDFSGELQRDARVSVRAGVCSLNIVVPEGTKAEVTRSGAVTTVKAEGTWTTQGDTYATSGSGPTLKIDVDMGLGTLTLTTK